ncbi:MAG: hypothetical protein R3B74_01740 [Nitrospirales bacterium]|nr:hypothetical protein [Nitrospirales bacterium]
MDDESEQNRGREWFVPAFGPLKFRMFIGLLFLPYTGMVLAYTVIGSVMAEQIHWDRVGAILVIYFFALGIGGHALDALGTKGIKPWGQVFSLRQLWTLAVVSLVLAYAIGLYYIIWYAPLLSVIALSEGFFLLAYNLEWFTGRFHTDAWFGFSWGSLPVLAGYILQTNQLSVSVLIVAAGTGLLSLVEIKASRPYKALKRVPEETRTVVDIAHMQQFEAILKGISLGVMLLGAGLVLWRWLN